MVLARYYIQKEGYMQEDTLNRYIGHIIDRILKGKKIKLNNDYVSAYIKGQTSQRIDTDVKNIVFKKFQEGSNKEIFSFGLRDNNISITKFVFYQMEENEKLEKTVAKRSNLDGKLIQALHRILVGISVAYECTVYLNGGHEKIVHRAFDGYLLWIKNNLKEGRCVYNPELFRRRFIQQTAETEVNIRSIEKIEYGMVKKNMDNIYGLKFVDNQILLSDVLPFYLTIGPDENIYFTYDEYIQSMTLLYALIKGYEFEY